MIIKNEVKFSSSDDTLTYTIINTPSLQPQFTLDTRTCHMHPLISNIVWKGMSLASVLSTWLQKVSTNREKLNFIDPTLKYKFYSQKIEIVDEI